MILALVDGKDGHIYHQAYCTWGKKRAVQIKIGQQLKFPFMKFFGIWVVRKEILNCITI